MHADSNRPTAPIPPAGHNPANVAGPDPVPPPPVIGVDVGGTVLKAAVVGPDGIGLRVRRPTPEARDPAVVLDAVLDVVAELRAGAAADGCAVAAVGIAVPGIIDESRGVAVLAANVGWRETPVRDLVSARTGLPVALGHDVRSACLAEWQVGAARGCSDVLLVTLGTGIGAGVVSDGRLLVGAGYAGQLGHVVVEPGGTPCACRQRGCLGTVASANAVVARYARRSGTPAAGGAGSPSAGSPPEPEVSAPEVAARARAGDPVAMEVWDEAVAALAVALVEAVTLFGSKLVVVGGGLALAGDQLLVPLGAAVREGLAFHRQPRIVPAELGDESGIVGASLLGRATLTGAMTSGHQGTMSGH